MSYQNVPDDLKPKFEEWQQIVSAVLMERLAQNEKWGVQNHTDFIYSQIFYEEVGEIAKAILHTTFGVDHDNDIEGEIIQSIAVLFAWLECRYRNKDKTTLLPIFTKWTVGEPDEN